MSHPVIIRVKRSKCVFAGCRIAVPAILLLGFCALGLWAGVSVFDPLFLSCILLGLFFAATSAYLISLGIKKPVALRMDTQGISGFFADPATWDEVAEVGVITGHKRRKFLGFTLHDPVAFRDRQTAWGRFKSYASGRSSGHHIVIPEAMMQDDTAETLAEKAKDFLSAHNEVT